MLFLGRASLMLACLTYACIGHQRTREEAVKDAKSALERYCVQEKCDPSRFSVESVQQTEGEWFVQFIQRQPHEDYYVSFVFTNGGAIETSRKREPHVSPQN